MRLRHVEQHLRRLLEGSEAARQVRVNRNRGRAGVGEGVGEGPAGEARIVVDGAGNLEVVHAGAERPDDPASEGPQAPQDDSGSFHIGHAVSPSVSRGGGVLNPPDASTGPQVHGRVES